MRSLAGLTLLLTLLFNPLIADEAADIRVVETILRIEDFDLASSEKAQAAVSRYLEANWGGERYLDLIRRFQLKAEAPHLLRLALEQADGSTGADSAALLAELGSSSLLLEALRGDDHPTALRAAKALSHLADASVRTALSEVAEENFRPASVRGAALTAFYGSDVSSQPALLAKVKAGQLPDDLKQSASEILMLSRDPKIREEAQTLFAVGKADYPPAAELIKRSGDPEKGKQLFATKTCIVCHEAGGVGVNFGPGLSEIGDKLDKAALYSAIMEPSFGISMGFEGWEILLKDGTPLLGIVGETDEILTVKMIGGATRSLPKSEVDSKKKLAQSLMYPGLHLMMSPDELVDLVEYLSTLKK